MSVTEAQLALLKKRWQYFVVHFVAFPPITFTQSNLTAGAITWEPFCLLSPRYVYTAGDDVVIYGTDSYIRGGVAADSVTFSKASGPGTVTDNLDDTCTVSAVTTGTTVVEAVATFGGQTHTGYAYVYYNATAGNLAAIASRVEGFSGSLATGEWKADIVLRGDYSAVLTNDGKDQPILMHVSHYWDASPSTFGGYKYDNNTFVLLCRDADLHKKHSGEYETILHLETPAYALKKTLLYNGEAKFSKDAGAGLFSTASLTPTDAAYYLLRKATNLGQYFNVSLWNNTSEVDNFNVRANANIWEAAQDAHGYNFGILYFDRWSNLNGKPDPRARYDEWDVLNDPVYEVNISDAHFLEYTLLRKRQDRVGRLSLQAVLPDMTIYEDSLGNPLGNFGDTMELTGLVAPSAVVLAQWGADYLDWLNTDYEMDFRMAMGHELNPGDIFTTAEIAHPLGDAVPVDSIWLVDDINYEFDFVRGFWTRRIHATKLYFTE
jgi:hypothetical protein